MKKTLISAFLLLYLLSFSTFAETILHRGNGTEPETLDIHKSSGVPEANIQRDLFEGLVTEAADGSLIPGVAERWEQSEDALKWTFFLRKEAKWSDGSPVTANDFVTAMHRAITPATASEYAFILWPIKNAEAISKGEIPEIKQLGVTAIDDHTLEITLENPTAYLPGLLAHHMAYPISQTALDTHKKQWTKPGKLISNGAYQLEEWVPQSHIKLSKNPHYRDTDNTRIDTVFYYPTEDKGSELKRFRAGELDVTEDIPTDQIKWVEENLSEAFHNSPYIGTYYIAINLEQTPFKDNAKLRAAMNLAIDRKILTEKVTKAGEVAATGWVPPGIENYAQQKMPHSELDKKAREAKALALYEEAGFDKKQPLEIELLYNTSDNHKKIAIALAAMWKKTLGIKVKLRNEEWKVYLNSRSQRQFQIIRAGWIGDYNDAYTFLSLFRSDVGTMNPSSYKNAEFDQLILASEKESNAAKRAELMQKAEALLLSEYPIIPIYHYTTQHLISPKIKGWKDNVMDIHPSRFLSKE